MACAALKSPGAEDSLFQGAHPSSRLGLAKQLQDSGKTGRSAQHAGAVTGADPDTAGVAFERDDIKRWMCLLGRRSQLTTR